MESLLATLKKLDSVVKAGRLVEQEVST